MKNNLKNIWIEVEGHLTPLSENELREVLLQKSKLIVNRFRWMWGIGTAIGAGVLLFLAIASFSLRNDVWYLINNSILAILLVIATVHNIRVFYEIESADAENSSVYHLLKRRTRKIEKVMQQKKQLFLLPVFSLLLMFAIHVYFSGGSFMNIFSNEESMWGIAFGFVSGLMVAIYFERKINHRRQKDLKALKTYLHELEKNN